MDFLLKWYTDCLDTSPLATKTVTTAAIGVLGDLVAQRHEFAFERKRRHDDDEDGPSIGAARGSRPPTFVYDRRRGLTNVANNVFLTTPIYHFGYERLESLLPTGDDSLLGSSVSALLQVLIDLILFDAIFVFLMFLCAEVVEKRATFRAADKAELVRSHLVPALLASWRCSALMVPVEFVIFRWLPLTFRTLGMNLIDLVWEAVVSFTIHRDEGEGESGSGTYDCGAEASSTAPPSPHSDFSTPTMGGIDGSTRSLPDLPFIECALNRIRKEKQS
mmetsp:Transcript_2411/g.5636  ORF Transcript_2411/g.5636 Transcript_2411/m.5636 type:complete len:276 (-) Transcript_2411:49-876(-)